MDPRQRDTLSDGERESLVAACIAYDIELRVGTRMNDQRGTGDSHY